MKNQIFLLILLITCFSSRSQDVIKITIPCNDALLINTNGRWLKGDDLLDPGHIGLNKTQVQEVVTRLDIIHKLVLGIFPQPMGIDARWHRSLGYALFGNKVKFELNSSEVLNANPIGGLPVASYYYTSNFYRYSCYNKQNEIWTGWPGETSNGIQVFANTISSLIGSGSPDTMTIDGRRVTMRHPTKETWKGYELYHSQSGRTHGSLLIHRKGELPYIPVTRKQYLDRCIAHLNKLYDQMIKDINDRPIRTVEEQEAEKNKKLEKFEKDFGKDPKKLKSAVDYYLAGYETEQQRRDKEIEQRIKEKNAVLRRYQDALEKTMAADLLNSPAIIPLMIYDPYTEPVFSTEAEGNMLVTENPAYMRKDLPKYVPQFIVLKWGFQDWVGYQNMWKIFEANFPVEKLQVMIDK